MHVFRLVIYSRHLCPHQLPGFPYCWFDVGGLSPDLWTFCNLVFQPPSGSNLGSCFPVFGEVEQPSYAPGRGRSIQIFPVTAWGVPVIYDAGSRYTGVLDFHLNLNTVYTLPWLPQEPR